MRRSVSRRSILFLRNDEKSHVILRRKPGFQALDSALAHLSMRVKASGRVEH